MSNIQVHVVNVKLHPALRPSSKWVYIGRDMTKVSPLYEASPLGNPFPAGAMSVEGSLACYEAWLREKMKKRAEPQWSAMVSLLHMAQEPDGVCIACWCHQESTCHGSVVKELLCQMASGKL